MLVHGAFADGSGWEEVAKILEKDGYKVSVAQPPETSYAENVSTQFIPVPCPMEATAVAPAVLWSSLQMPISITPATPP